MKRNGYVILLASVGLLGFATMQAVAYDVYRNPNDPTDGCVQCHPQFVPRTATNGLHNDTHVGNSKMTNNCTLCHTQAGDIPRTNSSGQDPGHGCNGCHVGPGLRLHHANAGAPPDGAGYTCGDCHSDPAPAGENVLPPYYSRVDVNVKDPCKVLSGVGGEDYRPPLDGHGLDNDGDLLYEAADSNCGTTPVRSSTWGQVKILYR